MMTVKTLVLLILSSLTLLSACSRPEPSAVVNTDHECTDTECNVEIAIVNRGADSFEINYHFDTYKQGTAAPVGQLDGNYTVDGHESRTISQVFPVTGKPNTVSTSVDITRLR